MSQISLLALVTTRFCVTFPVVGLSITCLMILSIIHSRSLLQFVVLLFQISQWLKSPAGQEPAKAMPACSWSKKAPRSEINTSHRVPSLTLVSKLSTCSWLFLRQLFTIYSFLNVESNPAAPWYPLGPSDQVVAIHSHTSVMGFIPPNFSKGNQGIALPALWPPAPSVCCSCCVHWKFI